MTDVSAVPLMTASFGPVLVDMRYGDVLKTDIPVAEPLVGREVMKVGQKTQAETKKVTLRDLLHEYSKLLNNLRDAKSRARLQQISDEISRRFTEELMEKTVKNLSSTYFQMKEVTAKSVGMQPQFGHVDQQVIKALKQDDILWDAYKGLGSNLSKRLNDVIDESFRIKMRPSMDQIREQMEKEVELSKPRLNRIIRTESTRVSNVAKMNAYHDYDPEGERLYKWRGPPFDPLRSSKHCQWLKEKIKEEGGAVTLAQMKQLWREASDRFNGQKWVYREGILHPNCRHVLELRPL